MQSFLRTHPELQYQTGCILTLSHLPFHSLCRKKFGLQSPSSIHCSIILLLRAGRLHPHTQSCASSPFPGCQSCYHRWYFWSAEIAEWVQSGRRCCLTWEGWALRPAKEKTSGSKWQSKKSSTMARKMKSICLVPNKRVI